MPAAKQGVADGKGASAGVAGVAGVAGREEQVKEGQGRPDGGQRPVAGERTSRCTPLVFLLLCAGISLLGGQLSEGTSTRGGGGGKSGSHSLGAQGSEGVQLLDAKDFALWEGPLEPPMGILLLAHGCSDACPSCVGLPEERAILDMALKQGYAALAVSSTGHCWDPRTDTARVVSTVAKFRAATGMDAAPITAFGASSGGAFVAMLARRVPMTGVLIQIMAVPPSVLTRPVQGKPNWKYPPAVFIHMKRDSRTSMGVTECVEALKQVEVPVKEVVLKPIAMTEAFFSERVPEINYKTSRAIFKALHQGQYLDAAGALLQDPRASEWRGAVKTALAAEDPPYAAKDSLEADGSPLSEVMNVAFAGHEISRQGVAEGLAFVANLDSNSVWMY